MKKLFILSILIYWACNANAQNIRFQRAIEYRKQLNYISNPIYLNDSVFFCRQNIFDINNLSAGYVNSILDKNGDSISNNVIVKDTSSFYGPIKILQLNNRIYSVSQYSDNHNSVPQFVFIKSKADGDSLITEIFGDNNSWDVAFDLILNHENNLIITGAITIANDGWNINHQCLLKMDTMGNIIWQKDLGIVGKDTYGNGVIETANHDYIINGYINPKTSLSGYPTTGKNLFVTCTDSAGNIKWRKQYGTTIQDEFGNGIIKGKNGFYLLGQQDSFYQDFNPPFKVFSETIGIIYFIDANGNVLWQKKYIDTTYETRLLNGFAIKGNEYVLLANKTRAAYNTIYTNNEPTIIKIDSVGNLRWKRQYYIDDSLNINPFQITLCPDSGYMVNGYVEYAKASHLADAYLLKVDKYGCLQSNCQQWDGVEEVVNYSNKEVEALVVYPNPASQSIVISHQPLVNTIEVTDVLGRVLLRDEASNQQINNSSTQQIQLDVSTLPNGIYFIKSTDTKGNMMNGKFVKE
ncbi:MAG: helicase [Bacteroidota bacterium]